VSFVLSDGRAVFRNGFTSQGLASDGEPIFGLYSSAATIAVTDAQEVFAVAGPSGNPATAEHLLTYDGRPVFRVGTSLFGIASDGEFIFGLPPQTNTVVISWNDWAEVFALAGGSSGSGAIAWSDAQEVFALAGGPIVFATISWDDAQEVFSVSGSATGGATAATIALVDGQEVFAATGFNTVVATIAITETGEVFACQGAVSSSSTWTDLGNASGIWTNVNPNTTPWTNLN
jgi:hypothetical protein